jgi:ABC-type bacteriocin/lantibiotic exporter with double-glycine peptidase domain
MKSIRYALAGNAIRFGALATFGLLMTALMATVEPLATRYLVDSVARHETRQFMIGAAVLLGAGILLRIGLLVFTLLSVRLQNQITAVLVARMMKAFCTLDWLLIRERGSAYFLSRVYDEPARVARGIVTILTTVATAVATMLASLFVCAFLSLPLTAILLAIVPPLYVLGRRCSRKISDASKTADEHESRLRLTLTRTLGAYTTIKIFDLADQAWAIVQKQLHHFLLLAYRRTASSRGFRTLSASILAVTESTVFVAAGFAVARRAMSIGALFGFMSAFWKMMNAAGTLAGQVAELSGVFGSIERMMEVESWPTDSPAEAPGRDILLDGVSAGYSSSAILRDLSATVPYGRRVLIVGENGSGKTTLAYMLLGFLKARTGRLVCPPRARISAAVTPFEFLPGSLRDNVRYDSLTPEQRRRFGELVEILGLTHKDRRDTAELSSGEKQKASIAMALMRDADVIILDEPLAHLDEATRVRFMDSLRELTRATVMVIMHGESRFHGRFEQVITICQEGVLTAYGD